MSILADSLFQNTVGVLAAPVVAVCLGPGGRSDTALSVERVCARSCLLYTSDAADE